MDKEILEKFKQAGEIAAQALAYGKDLIKPGASILEVTEKIEHKIIELGGKLAFPINISLNNIAAHDCAHNKDDRKFTDEIVKLDLGVHIDGHIGDTATTIDLSGKYTELVEASEQALNNAIKTLKLGVKLGQIGKVIEETIVGKGFQPIRNLSGHSLGLYLAHALPNIPNYDNNDQFELQNDMVFAIEPFATNGAGMIKETKDPQIFSVKEFKPMRINFARNIMKFIQNNFKTLPFSKRHLLNKFSEAQVNFTLKQLKNMEALKEHVALQEVQGGLVSQHEHSIAIVDGEVIVLTKI